MTYSNAERHLTPNSNDMATKKATAPAQEAPLTHSDNVRAAIKAGIKKNQPAKEDTAKVTTPSTTQQPKNPTKMAEKAAPTVSPEMVQRGDLFMVPLSKIKVLEGFNERQDYGNMDELVASVMSEGIKIPGLGYKNPDGTFTLTEGHRRRLAIELAAEKGKPGILMPLFMERKGTSDVDRLLGQLTNNDGKQFTMLEQARVIKRLVDMGENTGKIAKRRGVSPAAIDNLLILVSTSPQTQADVEAGTVSPSLVVDTVRAAGGDVAAAEEALAGPVAQAKEEGRTVKRNEVSATIKKISVSQLHTLADQLEDDYLHVKTGDEAKDAANHAHYTAVIDTLRRAHAVLNGERTLEDWTKKLPAYKRPAPKPAPAPKAAKPTAEEKKAAKAKEKEEAAAAKAKEKEEAKAAKQKEKDDAAKKKAAEKQEAATKKGATEPAKKAPASAAKKATPPAALGKTPSPKKATPAQQAIADLEDDNELNDVE